MIGGLYHAGDSALHRARAGRKLAALPVIGSLLFAVPSLALSTLALLVVLAGYPVARFGARILWRQLRGVLLVVIVVALAQAWFAGWHAGLLAGTRLTALLLLASLVTLTTRTSAIVAALDKALRPLRPLGVDPGKVGLAISLTLRFIPLVAQCVAEVREAQAARGAKANVLRLAVPVIVRLLKTSDEIAEAIDARS